MLLELFLGSLPALPAPAAYLCAGLLLFATGMGGVGVLQEVLLLALAASTAHGPLQPVVLALVAWVAIIAGDATSLWVGERYGARWIRKPWAAKFVAPERLPGLEAWMRRHAALVAFVGRWLPGQHGAVCFIAGTLRAPWQRFLVGDGLGVALQVPLCVWVANSLSWDRVKLDRWLDIADNVLTVVLVVLLLAVWAKTRRVSLSKNSSA